MKKLVSIFFVICVISVNLNAQFFHWVKGITPVSGISTDNAGYSYITGSFSGTATFGTTQITSYGASDIFIAKYDANGNFQWVQKAGGTSYEYAGQIFTDNVGSCYVTGIFTGPATFGTTQLTEPEGMFIAKYDSNGNFLWVQMVCNIGIMGARVFGVCADIAGNSYVTGDFYGTGTFGTMNITSYGMNDIFIVKYNANGNFQWVQKAGGTVDDAGKGVSTDVFGNIYVTGSFYGTATFGTTQITSYGASDIFIAKYSANGNLQWVQKAGGSSVDISQSISNDNAGNIYVTGSFYGTATFGTTQITSYGSSDVFIAKYSANGNLQWVQKAGGSSVDNGQSISTDNAGNSYITGSFSGTATFGTTQITSYGASDIFIAKYDANGNFQWVQKAGGSSNEYAQEISTDNTDNCYVSLYSDSNPTQFGNIVFNSSGGFIAKLGAPSISLISPIGGENWLVGSQQSITWNSPGVSNVKIEYTTNNGTSWNTVITSTPASVGSYAWTVPNTPSTQCKVKISDASNSAVSSISNSFFAITSPPVNPCPGIPTVTYTGKTYNTVLVGNQCWLNENLDVGTRINGSLNQSNNSIIEKYCYNDDPVNCLTYGGIYQWNEAMQFSTTPGTQGICPEGWHIPTYTELQTLVAVANNNSNTLKAIGQGTGSGQGTNTTGFSALLGGYRSNDGYFSNFTSYTSFWSSTEADVSNVGRIYLLGYDNSIFSSNDLKEYGFSIRCIKNEISTIQLNTPNGGENWQVGTQQNITWTSSNVTNIKVDYTTNNGTSWNTVITSTPASVGSYAWTVPNTPSTQCKVKISDVGNSAINDESNAVFTIFIPTIAVTSPNGGENWEAGTSQNIHWSSSNVANVKIEYTTNNGTAWNTVIASTPASAGTYAWTIPNTPSTQCKVRISDVTNSVLNDESNAVFTISTPIVMTLVRPNGGEEWLVGTIQNIKWHYQKDIKVRIFYSSNNGTDWNIVVDSTFALNQSFSWKIPATITDNALIKIVDLSNPNIYQISNSSFAIKDKINNWEVIPSGTDWHLNSVCFINPQNGWAVGEDGTILKSTNGGNSWVSQVSNTNNNLLSVYFKDEINGWITSQGGPNYLLRTTDSGNHWTQIPISHSYSKGIYFVDIMTGWIGGDGNTQGLWKTTNGGLNWTHQSINQMPYVRSIYFKDASNGWCAGQKLFRTSNGGNTWGDQNLLISGSIAQLSFVNEDIGYAMGGYGELFKTTDKGNSWIKKTIYPDYDFTSFFFNDTLKGWAVSDSCRVLRTSDGGDTWENILPQANNYLNALYFPNPENGIAVGSNGLILKYQGNEGMITLTSPNGGETWPAGSTQNIQWTSTSVTNVKIEYSADNGINYSTIIASTPASAGQYSWLVPNNQSTNNKIRISDVNNSTVNDISNSTFIISSAVVPIVTLTSPNGGENWQAGTAKNIQWIYFSITNIKIEYTTNNGTNWSTVIASTPASTGQYTWTVPNTPSLNCRVRISDAANSTINDISNSLFTISSLVLTSPNGGENWQAGTAKNIQWTYGSITNIKIEYTTDDGGSWLTIISSTPASTGQYTWTIPSTYSTLCRVKISDASNASVYDISNVIFTINSLVLTQPNGGETWQVGTTRNIQWTYSYINDLNIEYSTDNGNSWLAVTSSIPAIDGNYVWTVPNTPSDQCKVRISDAANSSVNDVSDAGFKIETQAVTPSVTLTQPNGGEVWYIGNAYNIQWSYGYVNNVNIEYSVDAGSNWVELIYNIPASTGQYIWTIPNAPSTNCLVKIYDTGNPSISDISNSVFSIQTPGIPQWVIITQPNGGELLPAGNQYNIQWTYSNINNLRIDITTDNGTNWGTIVSSTPALAGQYTWTVPNTPSDYCLIRLIDVDNQTVSDLSDSRFSIIAQTVKQVTVISPNGGEEWKVGDSRDIKWESSGITTLTIEYSTDNGTNWNNVVSGEDASRERYEWIIPNTPSSQCRVRISETGNPGVNDISNGTFTIKSEPPAGTITITKPNGGENWQTGVQNNIQWNYTYIQNVKLEFTTDGGNTWSTIAGSVPALDGNYVWTVPNTPSTNCRVRGSDASNPAVSDMSDGVFAVFVSTLTLTQPNGGETWRSGNQQNIQWTYSNVENILIEYSTDSGTSWMMITQSTPAADGQYSWTIPAVSSVNCRVKLSSVSNPSINDISDNDFVLFTYEPQIVINNKITFGDASDISNYMIIGLPGDVDIPIDWVMKGTPPYDWNAFWDNGAAADYQKPFDWSADFRFKPGKAFWILGKDTMILSSNPTSVPIGADNSYSILLHSGWNLISNPYEKNVKWSAVQSLNAGIQPIHKFDKTFAVSAEMEPYTGYYFNNSTNLTSLKIPYPVIQTQISKMSKGAEMPMRYLTLSLQISNSLETEVYITNEPAGKTGFDTEDIFAPPGDFEKVKLMIFNNAIENGYKYLMRDNRNLNPEGEVYDVIVKNLTGSTLRLKNEIPGKLIHEQIYFVDKVTGRFTNLLSEEKVIIPANLARGEYVLLLGNELFINEKKAEYLPKDFILYQNYPNPFNPATVISYQLSVNSKVSLKLFDILGNEVASLVDKDQDGGFYEYKLSALNLKLSSGVYFYQLKAGEFLNTKKMVLIK